MMGMELDLCAAEAAIAMERAQTGLMTDRTRTHAMEDACGTGREEDSRRHAANQGEDPWAEGLQTAEVQQLWGLERQCRAEV